MVVFPPWYPAARWLCAPTLGTTWLSSVWAPWTTSTHWKTGSPVLFLHTAALTYSGSHLVLSNYNDAEKISYVTLWDLHKGKVCHDPVSQHSDQHGLGCVCISVTEFSRPCQLAVCLILTLKNTFLFYLFFLLNYTKRGQ